MSTWEDWNEPDRYQTVVRGCSQVLPLTTSAGSEYSMPEAMCEVPVEG